MEQIENIPNIGVILKLLISAWLKWRRFLYLLFLLKTDFGNHWTIMPKKSYRMAE